MTNGNHVVLGEFLRMYREDGGLSQEQVGRRIGYSNDTISKIERSLMRIPDNKIIDVINAYGIPRDEFYYCAVSDYKRKLMELLDLSIDEIVE